MENELVKGLQVELNRRLEGLVVDGDYGNKTNDATFRNLVLYQPIPPEGSENFDVKEFKCNCHGRYCDGYPEQGISSDLYVLLEEIREEVNRLYPKSDGTDRPLLVRAGYRCPEYNTEVKGADDSQHLYGKAGDIYSPGILPATMGKICDKLNPNGGVGLGGNSIVHVDVRGHYARWRYD